MNFVAKWESVVSEDCGKRGNLGLVLEHGSQLGDIILSAKLGYLVRGHSSVESEAVKAYESPIRALSDWLM